MQQPIITASFAGLVDLASERLGGKALATSDDFFAEKENLLKAGRGVFIADKYTDRGKWMDGWESRRKRVPGHDWCIIRLGVPGVVRGVDIDTNHFLGNHPPYASIEGCIVEGVNADEKVLSEQNWTQILAKSPLNAGSQNLFTITAEQAFTHLRLNIYPDGGVARFRVYGDVVAQWRPVAGADLVDLVAVENGGRAVACSDMFFSNMQNLIMPGRSENMGDGWESRRRRGPGHDWVILALGHQGTIECIEVDTNHFKGNYPDRCSIEACYAPGQSIDALNWPQFDWQEILPQTKLEAHARRNFGTELTAHGPFTHVRLNIYPDGGVSRLRIHGRIAS
ncbi:MAG: allantoicase [Bradymonadaceae bacterium]|nr:allantoicase [Lujinxingiaceae bacterium]